MSEGAGATSSRCAWECRSDCDEQLASACVMWVAETTLPQWPATVGRQCFRGARLRSWPRDTCEPGRALTGAKTSVGVLQARAGLASSLRPEAAAILLCVFTRGKGVRFWALLAEPRQVFGAPRAHGFVDFGVRSRSAPGEGARGGRRARRRPAGGFAAEPIRAGACGATRAAAAAGGVYSGWRRSASKPLGALWPCARSRRWLAFYRRTFSASGVPGNHR